MQKYPKDHHEYLFWKREKLISSLMLLRLYHDSKNDQNVKNSYHFGEFVGRKTRKATSKLKGEGITYLQFEILCAIERAKKSSLN